jgi:hypothetical protein
METNEEFLFEHILNCEKCWRIWQFVSISRIIVNLHDLELDPKEAKLMFDRIEECALKK